VQGVAIRKWISLLVVFLDLRDETGSEKQQTTGYISRKNLHISHNSYFFLKILDVNADLTKMAAATVHDTTLWKGVRQRITRNVSNPAYYFDTVHFYKIR